MVWIDPMMVVLVDVGLSGEHIMCTGGDAFQGADDGLRIDMGNKRGGKGGGGGSMRGMMCRRGGRSSSSSTKL